MAPPVLDELEAEDRLAEEEADDSALPALLLAELEAEEARLLILEKREVSREDTELETEEAPVPVAELNMAEEREAVTDEGLPVN